MAAIKFKNVTSTRLRRRLVIVFSVAAIRLAIKVSSFLGRALRKPFGTASDLGHGSDTQTYIQVVIAQHLGFCYKLTARYSTRKHQAY